MKAMILTVIACVLGFGVGCGVNMALVVVGPQVIAPPAGVDVSNMESIRASIHLFEPRHFLFPFLAHAMGTLVGALVGSLVAVRSRSRVSFGIGVAFLMGGIAAATMIPAPAWFIGLDLLVAYLPMAWIGGRIGMRLKPQAT